jgi:hypothetical protein
MLLDFRDDSRIKHGNDPPAGKYPCLPGGHCQPLAVKLSTGAIPANDAPRQYAPAQHARLSPTIQNSEAVCGVPSNPTSRRVSPALAVPKPVSEE